MAGRLYHCLIPATPFTYMEFNQTRKLAFNCPPSFYGTQIKQMNSLRRRVTKMSRVFPKMYWDIPKIQQNALSLVGLARFSREKEKPLKSVAVSDTAFRGPEISKQALAVLVAMSCAAAFLCRCRATYAVDSFPTPTPQQLSANTKALWKAMWPKVLQVLSVFRDQGLIIFVLLCLSAFFSMAETSIMTLWPWKVVILLLTEITPKSIAVHNATEVARFVVRPVAWISLVLYPVGRVFTALSMGMLKVLGLKSRSEPLVTEEELKLMLRGAELSGAIEEEQQDMIENVLDFKDTPVGKVMTPLVDVVAIDAGATLMDFRNLWVAYQYSRVPVFERRIDNIVGIAYAMDMLDYVEQAELLQRLTVGHIAHKPAYFVPDSMSIWRLLREFRIRKVHMAIVLNEYGGTIGIVSLEDVVEEIVGEIFDESDSKEEIRKKTGYVVQRADGVYDVDANTSIEDLEEALEVKVAEGPYQYETVSGFVCRAFGYIPRTGQSTDIVLQKKNVEENEDFGESGADHHEDQREKIQKYKLEVLAGNARKVGAVRFKKIDGEESKDDKVTHIFPHIVKPRWEGGYETDDHKVQSNQETTLDMEAPTILSKNMEISECMQAGSPNHRVIAANVDIDAQTKAQVVDVSELTVVYPDDISAVDDTHLHMVQTDDIDVPSTRTSRETLKQPEKKEERRKRKRRKQSFEDSVDSEIEETVDLRHKETD
ncbi:hypothetical protein KI387_001815 [Taxus chinensis]|uniref:Uncharacterized protein n=1 Tax=Taxus chinensis TaxID=29808 RepID=A0AA38LQA8_TAXCH|nr:hypothetical protein KI387_001815 [Taxus chinensis]